MVFILVTSKLTLVVKKRDYEHEKFQCIDPSTQWSLL